MIDILLSSIVQAVVNPRWLLAVISGAVCALLFVGVLAYVGFIAATAWAPKDTQHGAREFDNRSLDGYLPKFGAPLRQHDRKSKALPS